MGDIQIDLPSSWNQQRVAAFSAWAMRLGIRKSVVGMNVKLIIPRSAINNLRRCIQAVFNISSSDDSSLPIGNSQLQSSSSTLNQQSSSLLNQSTLDTSHLSSRLSTTLPPSLQSPPSSRADDLSRQTLPALRALCKSYGVRVTGRKQELIDRVLAVENAFKQGITTREEMNIHHSLLSTPVKSSPVTSRLQASSVYGEESLLHQLRREEFEREHKEGDFYHDSIGQYRLSLDDQSSFSLARQDDTPSMSTGMPPPTSRLSLISETSGLSEHSSVLGALPRLCDGVGGLLQVASVHKKLNRRRLTIMTSGGPPTI